MNARNIQVCLSPLLLPSYQMKDTIAVVIDVFRATSSMCYGLANGASGIIPVAEIETCLSYRDSGYLLAAERNGEVVPGFDFGNSPFSYTREKVEGKTIVLTTTNGTRAIRECVDADAVVIGSFLNLSALSDWLKEQTHHILLVCAGWKDHVCLEDTVFAGALVNRLEGQGVQLDDSARLAQALFLAAQADIAAFLANAAHAKRMKKLHIEQDVAFCLQVDKVSAIPIMRDGVLSVLSEHRQEA